MEQGSVQLLMKLERESWEVLREEKNRTKKSYSKKRGREALQEQLGQHCQNPPRAPARLLLVRPKAMKAIPGRTA